MNSKVIIAAILFFAASVVNAQKLQWSRITGSDKEEYTLNHLTDKNGNIYIAGKTTGSFIGQNSGMNDGFVTKMDKNGKTLWSRQFGSSQEDDVQWSAIDEEGNIYITGFTLGSIEGENFGKEDIFLVKFDSKGNLIWKKQIGTEGLDLAKGICTDDAGYVYLTGCTEGKLGEKHLGKTDAFIMKLDKEGNIVRTNQFGTLEDDMGYSVAAGFGGGLFLCGTTFGALAGTNNGFIDCFTGHFSSDLNDIKFTQFGSEGFDIALVLHPDENNNIYIGGSTSGNFAATQAGEGDCFLLKQDEDGNVIWKKQFGTDHHDGVRGIDVTDNILISGILNLPPEKAFIQIYSTDGNLQWEKTFETGQPVAGTSGKDVLASKGGFTHLGLTGSTLFGTLIGGHDIYILKYRFRGKH